MGNYAMLSATEVLDYARSRGWLVNDGDEFDALDLRAQIASGDYFITLATKLDRLRERIFVAYPDEAAQLDQVVTELLYLQRNYAIGRAS